MADPQAERRFSEKRVQALISRFSAGDLDAFGELWEIFAPYVYSSIMRGHPSETCSLSEQDSEDLTSEVMQKVFKSLGRYKRKTGASFVSWLYTVAVNSKKDELKRRARATKSPIQSIDKEDPLTEEPLYAQIADQNDARPDEVLESPEDAATQAEKMKKLRTIINSLGPEEKFLINARYVEGLAYDEIAMRLEGTKKSASTLRKRWERILVKIRLKMAKSGKASDAVAELGGD